MTTKRALQIVFILVYAVIAVIPAVVFFAERGGAAAVFAGEPTESVRQIFPLFGLYAMFLLWAQILLGSLLPWMTKVFHNIFFFHRGEGVVAFFFAVTHPLLLTIVVGPQAVLNKSFVSPERAIFVTLGQLALLLLTVTVFTALLMRHAIFRRVWRKIHVLNYAVFVLAWVHSWNIGTDVRFTALRWLWLFYGITAAVAVLVRLTVVRRRTTPPVEPMPERPQQLQPPR
ncbi:MAG: ferric reductase-like transmembrane domain-containing protein [Candidatus Kerfeldbacteria bacterium]|nr:ferric reductase-like transmembrane domain-containing protein [Candidatus Kerfeldbacteria bacterium]